MISPKDFFPVSSCAVIGLSRNKKKFSNYVQRELQKNAVTTYGVNPNGGDGFFNTAQSIPAKVDAAVILLKSSNVMNALIDCKEAGIKKVWLQQGSATEEAIAFCEENGFQFVSGECIFMYLDGSGFPHSFHRFFAKLFHKY